MSTMDNFIAKLEQEVKNHSIYVWGGGGQTKPTITEAWITGREKTSSDPAGNAKRAIAYWKKQVEAGYGDVLRAFDCSGLGTFCLGKTKSKANTMMGWTSKLTRADLKRGDWVFRVDRAGKAYHIGYIVDDALNVIECKGRDYGVVKRHIDAQKGYWTHYGVPKVFSAEMGNVTPPVSKPSVPRNLKLATPYMRGSDVYNVQSELKKRGFNPGTLDGIYGAQTVAAVKAFQAKSGLVADGIAGAKTKAALGLT